ncbi:hypothetical protein [Aminipila sp.]|uniref:hypothetical protein n=1 Tax=Aminipila sp. TaxID=2060095 RepID=UPI0028A2937F|nr:hypothetical protein [Aminipila sp.]
MEIHVKKQMPKWKERSTLEKGLTVFGLILSISVIILSVLSLAGRWKDLINVVEPLLGLLMLIQTLQFWKYNKAVAIFSLFVALFIFGVAIVVFFFR